MSAVRSEDEEDDDDDDAEIEDRSPAVKVLNESMKRLSDLVSIESPSPVSVQLSGLWEDAPEELRQECVKKAAEACKLICSVIAPDAGEMLYESLPHERPLSKELVTLMTAFANAPTRNLKTQILSLYAYEFSIDKLQTLHEPYCKITKWQIKRARAHAKQHGPGVSVNKEKSHRISLDMGKVDHFVDFVNRPYFHQDVSYGMRKLRLQSGEVLEMPNVIRTVSRSTMITQYLQFCSEQQFSPLSRSTLYRILEVRAASQRKSLQGLDNTAADGSLAFETMKTICEKLVKANAADKIWSEQVSRQLDCSKQYLKTTYKVHCMEEDTQCADHCRFFSLSDPDDEDFQVNCTHTHNQVCDSCENIRCVMEAIEEKITSQSSPHTLTEDEKGDLLHDFKEGKAHILKWKSHIMRSINQEFGKQILLSDELDSSSTLLVMDWAMKLNQMKYREKQSEWFAKRGMSWHISSAISTNGKEILVTSYVHLVDVCTQDWFSVSSILENLLSHMKADNPSLKKVFLRSDEAGCYHNNSLIAAAKDIGERIGLQVKRYDFSEPQQGKDVCDRIICPLKSAIRQYCHEGNDIMNALDMREALVSHPVKGTLNSVCKISNSATQLEVQKIKQFSAYHNFQYEPNGVRVWKAYGIGTGKLLPDESIYVSHQGPIDMEVIAGFVSSQDSVRKTKVKENEETQDPTEPSEGLYECEEAGCKYATDSFEEMDLHIRLGKHSRFRPNESVYDTLRREWAAKFSIIDSDSQTPQISTATSTNTQRQLKMGWALSELRTAAKRFNPNVSRYLIIKFDQGEKTGVKADPQQVAAEMRTTRDEDGRRRFTREEWLSGSQIKGFFSRFAKKRRKQAHSETSIADTEEDLDEEDQEEEEIREELIRNIVSSMNVTHPIVYDTYNLCELYRNKKLSVFKVIMLREICTHFELSWKKKDKKADLIDGIAGMIRGCSCVAE